MIYAYDSAIQLPVRDIYDTQLMMASINAARDMYERGQKQMEDFYKSYGDFFSPIASDMDWYDTNVTGAARNFINEMYKNGVDPLRSAEGRSLVQQFVNNIPVGEINKRKQAAAAAQEYIKARGQLEAKGLWNPDYESYLLGGRSLETWDTSRDGLWTRTSPGEFSDLNAATAAWFNQLKPSYLRTEGGYDYFGVSPEAMDKVTASQIPGFIDSNLGRYHYELARRQLAAANIEQTPENIIQRLRDNIRSANSEVLNETREMNDASKLALQWKYKKMEMDQQHANAIDLATRKGEITHDKNGNPLSPSDDDSVRSRSFQLDTYNRTLNKMLGAPGGALWGGMDASTYLSTLPQTDRNTLRENVISKMTELNKKYPANNPANFLTRMDVYKNYWSTPGAITPNEWIKYMHRPAVGSLDTNPSEQKKHLANIGGVIANSSDASRLKDPNRVASGVMGQTSSYASSIDWNAQNEAQIINDIRTNSKDYVIVPTGNVFGAPMKYGRIKHYAEVDVYDISGTKKGKLYYDLNFNSVKNPRGYYSGDGQHNRGAFQTVPEFDPSTDRASARVDSEDKLESTDVRTDSY